MTMKIFVSFPESPKVFLALSRLLMCQNSNYLHICIVRDFSEEKELSKFDFKSAVVISNGKTFFINLNIYKKFHRLFKFFIKNSSFFHVILGNILSLPTQEMFFVKAKNRIILLDDGLLTLSLGELILKLNRSQDYLFYTMYYELLPIGLHYLKDFLSSLHLPKVYKNYDDKILGVLGSPLVESEFISKQEYELMLLKAMRLNNCISINYYMHRRENRKFENELINEFNDTKKNSLELILELDVMPTTWWSVYSSALVDLKLLNVPRLDYTYTPIQIVDKMNHPYLANFGIKTVEIIYQVYYALKFRRI